MPIISSDIDTSGQDAYIISADNSRLIVNAGVNVQTDNTNVDHAIQANGLDDVVINQGTLSGGVGVYLDSTFNQLINTSSGLISGDIGVQSDGSASSIVNNGEIVGEGTAIVMDGQSNILKNLGYISGNIEESGTFNSVINSGKIDGEVDLYGDNESFGGVGGTVHGVLFSDAANDLFDLSNETVTGLVSGSGDLTTTLSFADAPGAMTIDLGQGTAAAAASAYDFTNIEKVVGTHFADTITGDSADNVIAGGAGNDVIAGGAGNDTIDGGAGNDTLNGGAGMNTLSYVSAGSGVTVSLGSQGQAQATGGSGTDTFSNFQNLTGSAYGDSLVGDGNANIIHGGYGNDVIAGGNGNNSLYGDSGNDVIAGGTGNDLIEGDAGRDTLTGGSGADTFVFVTVGDSTIASPDLITDFVSGTDKIDISALHQAANANFTISSSGGYTYVTVDVNGDGTADALIKLTGANIVKQSDIIWNAPAGNGVHAASGHDREADLHHPVDAAAHHAVAHDLALYG